MSGHRPNCVGSNGEGHQARFPLVRECGETTIKRQSCPELRSPEGQARTLKRSGGYAGGRDETSVPDPSLYRDLWSTLFLSSARPADWGV